MKYRTLREVMTQIGGDITQARYLYNNFSKNRDDIHDDLFDALIDAYRKVDEKLNNDNFYS